MALLKGQKWGKREWRQKLKKSVPGEEEEEEEEKNNMGVSLWSIYLYRCKKQQKSSVNQTD